MNKCHNSQEESNTNVKDNDEAIVVSSEESECDTKQLEKNIFYKFVNEEKFITPLVIINYYVCNLGLMKAVGEANSLEGWANITDNALCKYHNDTEGIKFISLLIII